MWEPQRLTTLWAYTVFDGGSFLIKVHGQNVTGFECHTSLLVCVPNERKKQEVLGRCKVGKRKEKFKFVYILDELEWTGKEIAKVYFRQSQYLC
jgi:hypothetical protein